MCHLLHVLHARGIILVVWCIQRYTYVLMRDHDGNVTGDIYLLQ
jgi:hypothetical protein